MGTFYTECTIENHVNRRKATHIPKILVVTGSEYTRVSRELLKNIRRIKSDS